MHIDMSNSSALFVSQKRWFCLSLHLLVSAVFVYYYFFLDSILYRVSQKSKPLPNKQKIVLKPVNEIRFNVKLKYESSTIILFVAIRYSMRDLLSDLNNYA